jgi:peptidoglycan lytic transglycosylase A
MRRLPNAAPARAAAISLGLLLLASCAMQPGEGTGADRSTLFRPASVSSLPGWQGDDASAALAAFVRSCKIIDQMPPDQGLGGTDLAATRGGQAGLWRTVCANGQAVAPGDQAAARNFFEADFNAYRIDDTAMITGYFEPEYPGSKNKRPGYTVPLYAKPPVAGLADLPRSAIDDGALAGQTPVTAWLASPVDAFMLQIQGSGRIRLPDGHTLRVGFDGQNGAPYTPIGRVLEQQGALTADQLSFQSISNWLKAHPDQAREVMERNQRYVYLKPLGGIPDDLGAPGTLGVPLTPGRSLAVDASDIPLGAPVFVATTNPQTGAPLDRLTVAQDTGGGIKGAEAADLFFGAGPDAEAIAGVMRDPGQLTILLPKANVVSAAQGEPTS